MRLLPLAAVIWSLCCLHVAGASKSKRDHNRFNYYVLEHDPSHGPSAHECAKKQVGELQDHWVIRAAKPELVMREAGVGDAVLERFRVVRSPDTSVLHKRDESMRRAIKGVTLQTLRTRVKRGPVPQLPDGEKDGKQSARAVAERLGIRDPLFPDQWHLVNDEHPEHMMNVTPVWDMGITGHGVISAMVDDGLDYESDDLKDNFVSYLDKFPMIRKAWLKSAPTGCLWVL
jgi:kexin